MKEELIRQVKKLHKKLGRRPTKHDDQRLYHKSRKIFGYWNKLMEAAGYEVKYKQYPKIPNELNEDLAYFLGVLITDGHLQWQNKNERHSAQYCVQLYTSYEEEKVMLLKLIKELFEYKAFIRSKKYGWNKRINHEFHINSKELVEYLNKRFKIPTGKKSSIIRIPEVISNNIEEVKSNFLRGVIDGDGSIKKNVGIELSSSSELFLEDIKLLLDSLSINSRKISKGKTCYIMSLGRIENLTRLYELCYKDQRYCYPRKLRSLETIIFKKKKEG